MSTPVERYRNALHDKNPYTVDGLWFPGSAEKHEKIRQLPIKPDDVAVVCYPKSGTHWLYRIISFLNHEGDLDQAQHYPFIPIEVSPPNQPKSSLELIEECPSPRTITTHLPFELCPNGIQQAKCKVILIVRNPKDVAVSHFHFHKKLRHVGDFKEFAWADFLEVFCDPTAMPYGSWFGNVKNWLKHKDDPNVMLVRFEDLKQDLANGVARMAEFLGRPVTGDRAAAIAEKCEFGSMKKSGEAEGSMFLRKGVVGDWKSYFTVAQNEMFDELYSREMSNTGLELQFTV